MQEESISLYFKEGSSDKVYHAQLKQQDGGFMVTFQYGPRNGTLTSGVKTKEPVDYGVAKKAFDKVVKEKVGKGYSPGTAGSVFTDTALEARFTGIVPQLLNPIDDAEARRLLADPSWAMQEKYDGHRRLIRATVDGVVGINRKGLEVPLPVELVKAVNKLSAHFPLTLDGEQMGDTLAVFDVLEFDGRDCRSSSFAARLGFLDAIQDLLRYTGLTMFCAHTVKDSERKHVYYDALKDNNAEGAVFKRLDASYSSGRPNAGGNALKRKFTHSATVIVHKAHATKRSVSVLGLDKDGNEVQLGNVTIPANQAIPAAGDLIEVEYLYAFPGGSLFQPQYKGKREDLDRDAATVLQLVFKGDSDSDEDA